MPKKIPSMNARQLISLIIRNGCEFYREGKGDHTLFCREYEGKLKVVPIDTGNKEFSPFYVHRILKQFGFTNEEIDKMIF